MYETVTWRELLTDACEKTGDSIKDLTIQWGAPTGSPPSPGKRRLDVRFDNGFGAPMGRPFVAYSDSYVYFVTEYDGAEVVEYLPRNPDPSYTPEHF